MIIKHNIAVMAVFCLGLCLPLASSGAISSAENKVMIFGGKEGWSKVINRKSVTEGKGRFGYNAMMLSTNSRKSTEDTDLLLDFEKRPFKDKSAKYTVVASDFGISKDAAMGKGAALSRGQMNKTGGMIIRGMNTSIFGTEGPTGSFYIEFWLKPSVAENGEVVLSWRSSRKSGYVLDRNGDIETKNVLYQMFLCSFLNNRLVWDLTNMFDTLEVGIQSNRYNREANEVISLKGLKNVVPGKWSHHALIYDDANGALEYRVDGVLEDIKYITSTKHEGGAVYPMCLGVPADIEICSSYTGMIDDLRIQRGTKADALSFAAENAAGLDYSRYSTDLGRFETEPILVSPASTIESLVALMTMPPQTDVRLYVRSGDNFYNWNDTFPKWHSVKSGESIEGISGRYFQVACDLMSDGGGEISPSVTELQLHYAEKSSPLPPFNVRASAGDGSVTINWSHSVDESAGHYYVFYGTKSGEYLCRTAAEGASPIDAGDNNALTITGLKNGTIYYFAVAAVSKYDRRIQGTLSKEVYARPVSSR